MDKSFNHIIDLFAQIKDTRRKSYVTYTIAQVLFLVFCSQLCGFDSFKDIKAFFESKKSFIQKFYHEMTKCPSVNTIRRILALIEPKALDSIFTNAMSSLLDKEGAILAIDGKVHRGVELDDGNRALNTVSVYNCNDRLLIGQTALQTRGGELHAAVDLIQPLNLNSHTITADAAFCHEDVFDVVFTKKANFVIALKANQPQLLDLAEGSFERIPNDIATFEYEHRKISVIDISTQKSKWKHRLVKYFNSFIRIDYFDKDKEIKKTNYYVSNLQHTPQEFARIIRAHWGIENGLHWVLDVVFGEDNRRFNKRVIAKNESTIRRLALNCIKKAQVYIAKALNLKDITLSAARISANW